MIFEIALLSSFVVGGAVICRRMEPAEDADYVEVEQSDPDKTAAFDIETFEAQYAPVDSYEGTHRWDANFQWDEQEEKKVVRKVQ